MTQTGGPDSPKEREVELTNYGPGNTDQFGRGDGQVPQRACHAGRKTEQDAIPRAQVGLGVVGVGASRSLARRRGIWLGAGLLCFAVLLTVVVGCSRRQETGTREGVFSEHSVRGVRVLFKQSGSRQSGSVFAIMLAGDGNQNPDEVHCAHIAEHMVFHNPLRDGSLSLGSWVQSKGDGERSTALYNGWTGPDHTQFELTLPDASIPEALTRLTEALFPESIDETAYIDEINRRLWPELQHMTGNEQAAPLNAFRCAWFRGTPYDPGIFSVPVASVEPDKVLAWMKREYSPQRLTIVVVARAPEGAILDALDRALATVTEGPPPHPPAVRLSPAPLTTVELPSFGEPVLMAGVGADGVSQEDHLPLALAFSLAVRRATSLTVAGLSSKPELTGQLATSTTRVAFAGYALADTATVSGQEPGMAVVRLLKDALEDIARNGLSTDDRAQLEVLRQQQPVLPAGVPPTLIEAWRRGMDEVPGMVVPDARALACADSAQLPVSIQAAVAEYLPRLLSAVVIVRGKQAGGAERPEGGGDLWHGVVREFPVCSRAAVRGVVFGASGDLSGVP